MLPNLSNNSKGFTYLKGDCPVCNGERKDCRASHSKGYPLIHCRGKSPSYGYKPVGNDASGFEMYVSQADADRDGEEWQKETKEDRVSRKKQELENKRKARERQEKISLPIPDRDRYYRVIASQLALKPNHKANLLQRGLTDSQIEEIGFFSRAYGKLNGDFPASLPGVKDNYLSTSDGYFIPLFDPEGRISGYQISTGVKGNKYPWASNSGSVKLPNNENPLTHIYRNPLDRRLFLAEGTGKPIYAAYRHLINVLGASGGNFLSSPEQLTKAVKQFDEIIICIDAGENEGRMKTIWKPLTKRIRSLGHEPKFVWYGQLNKGDGDIDEITPETLTKAELLSFAEVCDRKGITDFKIIGYRGKTRLQPDFDITQLIHPKTEYHKHDGILDAILASLAEDSKRDIVNASNTGSGKSLSLLALREKEDLLKSLGFKGVALVSGSHRNPSIDDINKRFERIPSLSRGERYQFNDDGSRQVVVVKDGEIDLRAKANCFQFSAIRKAQVAGIDRADICTQCPLYSRCKDASEPSMAYDLETGDKRPYGYLGMMKRFHGGKQFRYITGDILSFTPEILKDYLIVVDESKSLSLLKTESFNLTHLNDDLNRLKASDKFNLYAKHFDAIALRLNQLAETSKEGRYQTEITQSFKDCPDTAKALKTLSRWFLPENRIEIETFLQERGLELLSRGEPLHNTNLLSLLECLFGWKIGSVLIKADDISLTAKNERVFEALDAGTKLILDATPDYKKLGLILSPDFNVIKQKAIAQINLTVREIHYPGFGSKQNFTDPTSIVPRLVEEIVSEGKAIYGDRFEVLGHKSAGNDRYFGRDDVGGNWAQYKTCLLMAGLPIPNLAQAKAEYFALYGSYDGQEGALYLDTVRSVIQSVGRPRASFRVDRDDLVFVILSDNRIGELVAHLLGHNYTLEDAIEAYPMATVNSPYRARRDFVKAVAEHSKTGEPYTQQAIAEILNIQQKDVSRFENAAPLDIQGFSLLSPIISQNPLIDKKGTGILSQLQSKTGSTQAFQPLSIISHWLGLPDMNKSIDSNTPVLYGKETECLQITDKIQPVETAVVSIFGDDRSGWDDPTFLSTADRLAIASIEQDGSWFWPEPEIEDPRDSDFWDIEDLSA